MIKTLQDKGAKCSFRYTIDKDNSKIGDNNANILCIGVQVIEFNGQTKQGQSLARFKLIKSANGEWKIEKFISRE